MFNPIKIIRGVFGGGPLVKAEGVADQISDKKAEQRFALGWIILCFLIGMACCICAVRH